MKRLPILIGVLITVILAVAGIVLCVYLGGYHGEQIDPLRLAPEFTLESDRGPVSLSDLRGDIDRQGNERLIWHYGISVEDMLSDLRKLAREAG